MSSAASATAAPHYQTVELVATDFHIAAPAHKQPHFAVEPAHPLMCEEATVTVSAVAAVHAPQELAKHQRPVVGTQVVGHVHVVADGRRPGTGTTLTVPLYQARVANRRLHTYRDREGLCIVDEPRRRSSAHHSRGLPGHSGRSWEKAALANASADSFLVCFVDLVSVTFMGRALLRSSATGHILAPTALFGRFGTAPAVNAEAATASKGGTPVAASGRPSENSHAQHHRRRVVMLPVSAAGETFELVCVNAKRARDAGAQEKPEVPKQ